MREETYVILLLPLRLYAGWVFLTEALGKMAGGWLDEPRLAAIVQGWLREGTPYSFYAGFLRGAVLAFPTAFTYAVIGAELLVGAALLAGLFTRIAAILGLVLTVSYLLARGDGAAANPTSPFIAILFTLLCTSTGRTLGLDAILRDRVPRWMT